MSAVLAGLLVGEAALPLRTQAAFLVLLAMGLAWASHGFRALRHRETPLVNQQLVAARMAVAFCAVFTLGALGMGLWGGRPALLWAAGVGALQAGVAVWMLTRANRRRQQLQHRLLQLQQAGSGLQS